jgi:hypothetical protein
LFPLFATGINDTSGKFTTDIVDTGGKFATGVVDTGGTPRLANISANFRKKLKRPYGVIRSLGETDPRRKPEVENLVALSL